MNIRTSVALLGALALAAAACKSRNYSETKSDDSDHWHDLFRENAEKYIQHTVPAFASMGQDIVEKLLSASNGKYDLRKNLAVIPQGKDCGDCLSNNEASRLRLLEFIRERHLYQALSFGATAKASAEAFVCDKRYNNSLAPAKISFSSEPEPETRDPRSWATIKEQAQTLAVRAGQFWAVESRVKDAQEILVQAVTGQKCWNETTQKTDDCKAPDEKRCGNRVR